MMKTLLKTGIVVSALLFLTAAAHADESDLKTFSGPVQEIDWVGSLLTVGSVDEMTFFVPPGTKITRGTDTVGLSDLDQDDYVVVRYRDNPSGAPKAVKITVNKAYPAF